MSHAPKKTNGGASKAREKSRPNSACCADELLKPLADMGLITSIRGYLLGPDRYHEAMLVMDAGSAALAAAQKAKTLLLKQNMEFRDARRETPDVAR